MLITESIRMLMTTPEGKIASSIGGYRSYIEVAAVVIDLVEAERLEMTNDNKAVVSVVSTEPTGNRVLDFALEAMTKYDGQRLQDLIQQPKLDPDEVVTDSLVEQGIFVRGERGGLFGWGRQKTPEVDAKPEQELRQHLARIISGAVAPTAHDAALIGVISAVGDAYGLLREEAGGLRRGPFKKRLKEIVEDTTAYDAISSAAAIEAAMTASTMAIIMPAVIIPMITSN